VVRAFTLVELLVVLILIAVMTSSVVVALHGRDSGHALRTAAEDLSQVLRYAEHQSRMLGRAHRVIFDGAARFYWVEVQIVGVDTVAYERVPGMAGSDHRVPDGIILSGNLGSPRDDVRPTVFEFGAEVDAFEGEIALQNEVFEVLRVVVLPETHQVRILELD
jgi:prepilin-type N-terminal cleavage/methylation domain-containing protein